MENIIYFDNSATTKPCQRAVEYIEYALKKNWGNPSSLHMLGIEAEEELNSARTAAARVIGARNDEIYFTSGGTEANNLSLIGAALARKKRGNRIVTTSIEHPSVLNTVDFLQSLGFEVIKLPVSESGQVSVSDIEQAVNDKTILVSIMLVNNETGTVQPVFSAANAIKKSGAPALLHCDAVQAFGKLPVSVSHLGVDLMSVSGHKIHASKGVGFLYKKKSVNITPVMNGGGQENGLRSGTECVPLISGLRGAIEELGNINENLDRQKQLWLYAKEKISATNLAEINSPNDALPYILNISVLGYRSETLLHFLDSKGIYVSSGSACAKGHKSYVMSEMGLDAKRIDSALRLSFSRYNTKEEIDRFCAALKEACRIIRKA